MPTLTAAAAATARLRLGTLVTSPNFRHPVTLAKELISLDDISGGRITLGIGAGGNGFDATALGQEAWTPRERADRFAEFVAAARPAADRGRRSPSGATYYSARRGAQHPRLRPAAPAAVRGGGHRPARAAAGRAYGQAWVTTGDPKLFETGTPEQSLARRIRGQIERLGEACAEVGRDVGRAGEDPAHRLHPGPRPPAGVAWTPSWTSRAGTAELGITEIVLHWPIADSDFAADQAVFEQIATEAPAQLA